MREKLVTRIRELAREIVIINNRMQALAPTKKREELQLVRKYRQEREQLKAQLRAL